MIIHALFFATASASRLLLQVFIFFKLMASSSQPAACGLVKPTGDNLDIAWKWNSLKNITDRKSVTCDFCHKTTTGGITWAKKHQVGITGDVGVCKRVPPEVKALLKEELERKKGLKDDAAIAEMIEEQDQMADLQEILSMQKGGKRPQTESSIDSIARKKSNVKGPLDALFFRDPETAIKLGKATKQTNIKDGFDKEARTRTIQYIERFLINNMIPFNVVNSRSFHLMLAAVGNYGQNLKGPTYHECRVPLLKSELQYTKELMKGHEEERALYGCSIMSDGWTDRNGRTLINFLVNCPKGSMFVRSVDASGYMKTGEKIFELLDSFVEEIGESNVVQVISDNGSNFKMAGRLLEAKRSRLFWTPCAAHCIDLILEDIGKIPRVKMAIQRGIGVVGFIYNHTLALNMMRQFTKKMELVRHGVTRFATSFLTLQRLHKQKANLRSMFTSDEWKKTNIAKDRKAKKAVGIVLMPGFWNDVHFTLKAMGPLVQVLRLVDNEKKPAMGYIYEAMDRAKEAIQKAFGFKEEKYKAVFKIIDDRWDGQLHHPLHAAGHFLNPEFFYKNPLMEKDPEVMKGLYKCIEKLSGSLEMEEKISIELQSYKRADGMFGLNIAKKQRTTISPAEWWKNYGSQTPNAQQLAIKVLSLTCSSSGCERNWSVFEHIHSKKRSRLDSQRLQDLVYIKYNQALKLRADSRDVIDPILLNDIDESNEWLLMGRDGETAEEDLVFGDDNLTWGDVANAAGVSEPLTYTRQRGTRKKTPVASASSSRSKGKEILVEEDDEEINEVDDDEEEDEFSNSDSSDNNEPDYDYTMDDA